jgi:hypothetical protein
MALLATLHDHRRAAERQALDADATLRVDGRPLDALIANISASGCLFVCSTPLEIGDTMTIGIAGVGRRLARVVRAEGQRFGAAFDPPLLPAEIEAAVAVPGDTVVSFPLPIAAFADDEAPPAVATVSPVMRLIVLAGLSAATWSAVVIALRIAG